jgi:hypothetical protein
LVPSAKLDRKVGRNRPGSGQPASLLQGSPSRLVSFGNPSNANTNDEGDMSLLLILLILLVLFGGGGFYAGGPRTGISLGGLILIIIVVMALTGRL